MSSKRQELLNPNSCFNKAGLDEPIFVLRGKDAHCSVAGIKAWLHEARRQSKHEHRELALDDIVSFRAYCESLEQGLIKHEPIDQAGLTRFLIENFAPELVQRMSQLEQQIKERDERDAREVSADVEDAGAGIALEQLTVAHAAQSIHERYTQYSVEDLTVRLEQAAQQHSAALQRAHVHAEQAKVEQAVGDEADAKRAEAIDEGSKTQGGNT